MLKFIVKDELMNDLKHEIKINRYLSIIFLINIIQSLFMGLAYDESYYWIYTNSLSFGHFDHPPMVGWLIKLGTLIWGHSELGVRFFFNVLQILTLKILWKLSNKEAPQLFIITSLMLPLVSVAGFLALPDTPLMFFSVLFLYLVKRYQNKDNWIDAVKIAVTIALLFYSKYHGIMVVFFTVLAYPAFLKRKSFWMIVVLTTFLFLPHVYWQYQHDFVTFDYHLFKRKQHHFKFSNIINYLAGQFALMGLFAAPIVLYSLWRLKTDSFNRILKFNIWGLFGFLLFSSLRNKIEANWTITSFAFLVPVVTYVNFSSQRMRQYFQISAATLIIALMGFRLYAILPIESPMPIRLYEFKNWSTIVTRIQAISNGQKLVGNNYQICAKVSFYYKKMIPCMHLKTRSSQFAFLQNIKYPAKNEKITFISYFNLPGSVKIDLAYPQVIYIKSDTTINEIESYLDL